MEIHTLMEETRWNLLRKSKSYTSLRTKLKITCYSREELPMSERLNAPMQDAPPNCEISQWGEWSDCSSKCDTGSK